MQTEQPHAYVHALARWVRAHEAALSGGPGAAAASSSAAGGALGWLAAPGAWLGLDYLASSASTQPLGQQRTPQRAPRPARAAPQPLPLSTHHLYYLLLHFDSLALPAGDLAQTLPPAQRARPVSFAYVPATTPSRAIDTDARSIASVATALSAMTLGTAGWWREKEDPARDGRYLYSALTKIPALSLSPLPACLLAGFEDSPGTNLVPLDVFKNLSALSTSDVDVRMLAGWDRLACQLRSLSARRCSVEDVEEVLCGNVRRDARRRRGDGDRRKEDEGPEDDMPSLAWHFLAHLSLASNNLTFFPAEPLVHLDALVSLDLSSNLLNSVPPALSSLANLTSLNLSDNLIDSLLGIPDALPAIQSLNLSANRLSSLCGLERLGTLRRIDLRRNDVYEVAEVGRLAPLPHVCEIWVKGNPLQEEEEDPRVQIFQHFAHEGRDIERLKIDDEAAGFFERQRITQDLASRSRRGEREETPSAESPPDTPAAASTEAAEASAPKVVQVRHAVPAAAQKAQKRRARRVVHLHDDASSTNQAQVAGETTREEQQREALLRRSSAEGIVQAVREGRLGDAMGQAEARPAPHEPAKSALKEAPRSGVTDGKAAAGPSSAAAADAAPVTSTQAAAPRASQAPPAHTPETSRTSGRPANSRAPLSGTFTRKSGAAAALLSSEDPASPTTTARDASSPTRPRPERTGSQTLGRSSLRGIALGDEAGASQAAAQRRPNKDALARRRKEMVGTSLFEPTLSEPAAPRPAAGQADGAGRGEGDMRKRLETLRQEFGADWLTALSRGSVYMDDHAPGDETR